MRKYVVPVALPIRNNNHLDCSGTIQLTATKRFNC